MIPLSTAPPERPRFGSRTIEAASYSDVAVRYLRANHYPDHDTICTFRTANEAAIKVAFVTVLKMAQHLKLRKTHFRAPRAHTPTHAAYEASIRSPTATRRVFIGSCYILRIATNIVP